MSEGGIKWQPHEAHKSPYCRYSQELHSEWKAAVWQEWLWTLTARLKVFFIIHSLWQVKPSWWNTCSWKAVESQSIQHRHRRNVSLCLKCLWNTLKDFLLNWVVSVKSLLSIKCGEGTRHFHTAEISILLFSKIEASFCESLRMSQIDYFKAETDVFFLLSC